MSLGTWPHVFIMHHDVFRSSVISLFPLPSSALLHLLGIVTSHHALLITVSLLHCLIFSFTSREAKLKSCYIVSLAIITFFSVCILFGAHPFRFWDNLCWSFFVASILSFPAVHLIGCKVQCWKRIFLECRFDSWSEWVAYIGTVSTLVGVWVGAFPILLDWNRPWQVWPIPCSVGALIGNWVGYSSAVVFVLTRQKH